MGDGAGAVSTEVFEGATVIETVLEEVDGLLVGDVDYGGALVEKGSTSWKRSMTSLEGSRLVPTSP
jgi:hypothetical protein